MLNDRDAGSRATGENLECGGRAQRRHRFPNAGNVQSGVALRFPPQSKTGGGAGRVGFNLYSIRD